MFNTSKPFNLGQSLIETEQTNQLQQLKTMGSQPRPGILSPNVIQATNAPSISTPQHVSNVRVSVARSSDVSSKVTVAFNRNANDPLFSQALVHVTGYKGNPQPVQVAGGQSPVSFELSNTGERVGVRVQASGSLGPAPLQTAPSGSLILRSTPLSTVTTPTGTGPTPPPVQGVNLSSYAWLVSGGSSLVSSPPSGYVTDLPNGYVSINATNAAALLLTPVQGTTGGGIDFLNESISIITQGGFGCAFWNSSSNKSVIFFGQGTNLYVQRYTGITTVSSTVYSVGGFAYTTGSLKLTYDATNLYCYLSVDAAHFVQVYSEALSSWVGTPTHYGFVYGDTTSSGVYEVIVTKLNTY